MRNSYIALVHSVMLYGVSAWGPWLSTTNWKTIECAVGCLLGYLWNVSECLKELKNWLN